MPGTDFKALKSSKKPKSPAKPAGVKDKVINILDLYTMIAQNKYPSVSRLVERYSVTERSIHRYLDIIRRIDPVVFDREKGGYRFEHGDRIKKLILDKEDFMFLMMTGETMAHLGSPFKKSFQHLIDSFQNVKKGVPKNIKEQKIFVKIPDAYDNGKLSEYFQPISEAVNERRSIEVLYQTLYSGETTERRIDPYGLVYYEGSWVLMGYCHLRDCVRHFAIDRINRLRVTNFYFKLKDDFDLNEHVAGSWGVYDEDKVDVTVRFAAEVADYITRKDKWHPSEIRQILPNGDVELAFRVAGVDEIKRWIYSWLPYVRVIEPKCFREQIREELASAVKNHR